MKYMSATEAILYKGFRIIDGDMAGQVLTVQGDLARECRSLIGLSFRITGEDGQSMTFEPTGDVDENANLLLREVRA
jgi:hypothetical protein